MKTATISQDQIDRRWCVIDATDKTLGRLATQIATRLRGKHKPEYSPHLDVGDYVVVINAEKIAVTGNKRNDKLYYTHSGYIGGLKKTKFKDLIAEHPIRVIEHAVKGMLPKNILGRRIYRKLKLYAGPDHPHEAQNPEILD